MGGRFEEAVAAIDAANAADPATIVVRGAARPKELAHAELMTEWVERLDPDADEAQLLAARGHHLRRWAVPRSTYPEGRAGYLRWRAARNRQHAAEVAELLTATGYDAGTVERVQHLIAKSGSRTDPDVQVHEDALCLVFLETQLAETAAKLGDDKVVDVIRKTTKKMSERALHLATGLPLTAAARALLDRALEPADEAGGA